LNEDSFHGPSTVPQIGLLSYVLVSLVWAVRNLNTALHLAQPPLALSVAQPPLPGWR
jgi:hypothetical protein